MTQDDVERKASSTEPHPATPYYPRAERYRPLRGQEIVLWDEGGFGGYPRLRSLADSLSMQVSEFYFKNLIALRDYKGTLTLFVQHHHLPDRVDPLGAEALAIWRVLDMGGEEVYLVGEDDLHAEWRHMVSRSEPQKVVFLGKKGQ